MKNDFLKFEREFLSPHSQKSEETRGRLKPLSPCALRTEFQRDRDRIIHCKAFRRLKHKTQVFLAPHGDHYRTRLTHTLEVTQIARTISRALLLNEDLTEAIALGHDLGHTPFGHMGERVLNEKTGSFSHNEQGVRTVDILEKDGEGLNLTFEVRDGILHHSGTGTPATLEGKVVCLADRFAYLNHDIDDALRAGVLKKNDLPKAWATLSKNGTCSIIDTLVADIIKQSYLKPDVMQGEEASYDMLKLRDFMFERVYISPEAKNQEVKANKMIGLLYDYLTENPSEVPAFYRNVSNEKAQFITDYIAGMTDHFAVKTFREIFEPKFWEN